MSSKKKQPAKGMGLGVYIVAALIFVAVSFLADKSGLFSLSHDKQTLEGSIIISEVCASNNSLRVDENGRLSDWVTVKNISDVSINIGTLRLVNGTDLTGKVYSFRDTSLHAGESITVWCSGLTGGMNAPFKIASAGDTLTLFDGETMIDCVITPELPSNSVYSFDTVWEVTFPTSTVGEISGEKSIIISEIMPSSATYNGGFDYIELYNPGTKSVDVTGWYLSDSDTNLTKWSFPHLIIPAGSYTVISCGGEGELNADFRLSAEGETVTLVNSSLSIIDRVTYPALSRDRAWSLTGYEWTDELAPTPGLENTAEGAAKIEKELRNLNVYGIYINEIMASENGNNDWLEIRNTTGEPINISGWGLSDKSSAPRKWQFPANTIIPARGYLGVYLSGLGSIGSGGLHTNFSVSIDGMETLVLSNPEGHVVDRIPLTKQYTGISYGRIDGKDGFYYLSASTPSAQNVSAGYISRLPQVAFSIDGGIYEPGKALTIELSSVSDAEIWYTLDCSEPDPSNINGVKFTPGRDDVTGLVKTYKYSGPITIDDTTVVRAVAMKEGCLSSITNTQSYILADSTHLQVVSLVSDPRSLYDFYSGIYVSGPNPAAEFPYGKKGSGANFWMEWERDASVELFGTGGETILSQGVVIKLHGNYSRAYRAKAFKVYADGKFGISRFYADLFPNRDYTEYKSFLLRTGGQDYKDTHFRDSLLQSLADGTSVMHQDTNEVVLYLNGIFWGQYNMREHITPYSVCQWENWNTSIRSSIDMLSDYYTAVHGSRKEWIAVRDWIRKNGIDTQEKLDYVAQFVDLDNFMEFVAIQMFVANEDYQNVKMYRSDETDGKWRFILYDLDMCFYKDINSFGRYMTENRMGKGNGNCNELFMALMKNPVWRDKFLTYFAEKLATDFSTESMLARVDAKLEKLGDENAAYYKRWDVSENDAQKAINSFKKYCQTRPGRMLYFLAGLDKDYKNVGLSKDEMQKYFGDLLKTVDILDANFKKVNY